MSAHQKMRIAELAVLMVIGGIIESFSVSMMLPFMEIAMNPEETMNNKYVVALCEFFGIDSSRTFLIFLTIVLAVLYVLKNIYLMAEYSMQYRFVYGNMFMMKSKMLNHLIHRPYEYFLNLNSGEMLRIINNDISGAFNVLTTLLSLFTEIMVSMMLLGVVFLMAPMITVTVAALMLILLALINVIIKPILRKAAIDAQKALTSTNKWLLQSIQGIKDVKVMGKEDFFCQNFDLYGKITVKTGQISQTVNLVPRFLIEAVSMSSMFVIVAVMLYRGTDLQSIVPTLTTIAMAAIRLLPSVNRMSSSIATIAYNEPFLDKTIENIKGIEQGMLRPGLIKADESETSAKIAVPGVWKQISFHNISYHYPNSEKYVLQNASFEIKRGEAVGIIGASGAGKTTAVDIILGLLMPESGHIYIDDVDIFENIPQWIAQVGYIPQMIFMLDDSIRSNVAFGISSENVDDEDVWKALEEAALDDFVRSLPEKLDTEIGERGVRLSGGQRQRIGIARALYRNPEVLFFDEATSALDTETEDAIMESIHKLQGQKTIIIIAHRLTTIANCTHVFKVENGSITKER